MRRVLFLFSLGSAVALGLSAGAWWLQRATLEEDRVALGRQLLAQLPAFPAAELPEPERRIARLAAEFFDRVLAGSPGLPEALRGRARARLVLGDWSGAREDVAAVAQGRDRQAVDLALFGALSLREGREKDAQVSFEAARALAPADDPAALAAAWLKSSARDPALRDPAKGWRELAALRHLLPSPDDKAIRSAVGVWLCCFREPSRLREVVESSAREALDQSAIDEADFELIRQQFLGDW